MGRNCPPPGTIPQKITLWLILSFLEQTGHVRSLPHPDFFLVVQ